MNSAIKAAQVVRSKITVLFLTSCTILLFCGICKHIFSSAAAARLIWWFFTKFRSKVASAMAQTKKTFTKSKIFVIFWSFIRFLFLKICKFNNIKLTFTTLQHHDICLTWKLLKPMKKTVPRMQHEYMLYTKRNDLWLLGAAVVTPAIKAVQLVLESLPCFMLMSTVNYCIRGLHFSAENIQCSVQVHLNSLLLMPDSLNFAWCEMWQ